MPTVDSSNGGTTRQLVLGHMSVHRPGRSPTWTRGPTQRGVIFHIYSFNCELLVSLIMNLVVRIQ